MVILLCLWGMSNGVSADEVSRGETQGILQTSTHCSQSLVLDHFTQLEGKGSLSISQVT